MKHTGVRAVIKPEVLKGLSGRSLVDYVIGAVEEAVELLPFDRRLQGDYQRLRKDETFRLYFSGSVDNRKSKQDPERQDPGRGQKDPSYKALNGF